MSALSLTVASGGAAYSSASHDGTQGSSAKRFRKRSAAASNGRVREGAKRVGCAVNALLSVADDDAEEAAWLVFK